MGKQYTWKLLKIVEKCAEAYDLTLEEVRSPARHKTVCEARLVSAVVCRSLGYHDAELSLALRRHRTTVIGLHQQAQVRPEIMIKASKLLPKLRNIAT